MEVLKILGTRDILVDNDAVVVKVGIHKNEVIMDISIY